MSRSGTSGAGAQTETAGRRLLRRLLPGPAALAILAVVTPIAVGPLRGWDVFFNIAQGRWILAHGFPSVDPFSVTAGGPWFPHEWGFSVLMAWAVEVFGGFGPGLVGALLTAAQLALVWRLLEKARGRPDALAVLLFAGILAVQSYAWYEVRTYYLGNLMFLGTLWLAVRWREGSGRLAWLLVPGVALWANLHGSWPLAPALLGSVAVGRALDLRRIDRKGLEAVGASVLSVGAAAASPGGLGTVLYPVQMMVRAAGHDIQEWAPLAIFDLSGWAMLGLLLLLVFTLARAPGIRWASALPAVGLAVATVGMSRHALLACVVIALTVAEHLGASPEPRTAAGRGLARAAGGLRTWAERASGLVWPFVAVALLALPAATRPLPLADHVSPAVHPIAGVKRLAKLPPGRVLNRYGAGALVSAVAGPGQKVFIDGRADNFPDRLHVDYRRLVRLEPGWREALDAYDPDYLLWGRDGEFSALLEMLRREGGWRPLVEEPSGVLWVRERGGGRSGVDPDGAPAAEADAGAAAEPDRAPGARTDARSAAEGS